MITPSEQSYRLIPLTQGQFAKVDADDYEWLNQWTWHAWKSPCTGGFYAICRKGMGRTKSIKMHRLILGLDMGNPLFADHINRDTLDNRRSNLRTATRQQNRWNRPVSDKTKSGRKGVYLSASGKQWIVAMQIKGKNIYLGRYPLDQLDKAGDRYEEVARQIHGEFACF